MSFWSRSPKLPKAMVDLHCHVIPGLDDGAESLDESLAMLRLLQSLGYCTVAATTHLRHPYWEERKAHQIREGLHQLQQHLATLDDLSLEVVVGAEVYYDDELLTLLDKGRLITLADGPYLLLEFSVLAPLRFVKEVIFELRLRGITPIIAHPERYQALFEKPEMAEDWVEAGCLLQLDLPSMLGDYGRGGKKLAQRLLKKRLYHLAATDLHHLPAKTSLVRKMLENFIRAADADEAHRLLVDNPQRILQGKPPLD